MGFFQLGIFMLHTSLIKRIHVQPNKQWTRLIVEQDQISYFTNIPTHSKASIELYKLNKIRYRMYHALMD